MDNKLKSKIMSIVHKIKLLLHLYWKELLLEAFIIILIFTVLSYLDISLVNVIDGSLIVILIALPVTIYNWIGGKRDRFFNENIELLVNINKDEFNNDELVDLRLTQVNYIYENKMKSAEENKLEHTIINTISRLVLDGISVVDEIRYEDVEKIYKRLGLKETKYNLNQCNSDVVGANNNKLCKKSKFNVVNDLFVEADNPLILKSDDFKSELFVYLNYETELSKQINGDTSVCLIANSILNVNNKDYFDNFKSFSLHDSQIKFATPLTKEDFCEFKNDESISNSIKKIHSSNSVEDKYFKELINSEEIESAELEAKLNWIDKNLRVSDRKQYRDIIRNKYENSFIKFSRSYAKASEPNVRAGWFCINESMYKMIYDDNKFSTFFFIINANPDIESQEDGICVQFDRETMKKYFDKKEGDSFAINKDKYDNKLYQFYLYYEKDSKLLLDNRVKSGEPVKIKITN